MTTTADAKEMKATLAPQRTDSGDVFLPGIRVLEIADELGEYCGKVLAMLGAAVIKVEPPEGEFTRRYGPFYQDRADVESSLYHWHYNFGKRGITLNFDDPGEQERFRRLARTVDVVLDTRKRGYMDERGIGYKALKEGNPGLVFARITPFGDDGPWADFKASDLTHLALGGVMMNCGYDPDPTGFFDTPPVAPQMWQAYHIAGEMTAIAIIGALFYRYDTGQGQFLSTSIHEAVAKQTEGDMPSWIYSRKEYTRHTGAHSFWRESLKGPSTPSLAATKDGRWVMPLYMKGMMAADEWDRLLALLDRYGMADDLTTAPYKDPVFRLQPAIDRHIIDIIGRFINAFLFDREIWREGQAAGLVWGPERRPEESIDDEHWQARETFIEVDHPELGRRFIEIGAKWMCLDVPWPTGPRAPLLGEHNHEVWAEVESRSQRIVPIAPDVRKHETSKHGKPFALAGVRFVDLTWLLASGGAGRYFAAQGAEVIKIEHKTRPDWIRWGTAMVPPGLRPERHEATGPLNYPIDRNLMDRGGFFLDINAGKRHASLNLKHPRAKELLWKLLATADVVAEGFSPGTMDRMGFGYDRLKAANPKIVYAQQSGMGQIGTYGQMRSLGPIAQAFSGMTEMSGLPEPFPPAGIGYSFLDWFGAYNLATAIMAGIYRQRLTGKGCWIDSSQVESGIFLTGTAILDYSANGRRWQRYGNRSPYKPAAPHGAYRTAGDDRWIAIACFDDAEWKALLNVLGRPAWGDDPRFVDLAGRTANHDALDALVNKAAEDREGYELMVALQQAGVTAGVCQTAEDRYEKDPQLKHLKWLTELKQSEIGTWPVKEFPVKFSETPAYMGGPLDRHSPSYGEDNDYVFGEILGLSSKEIRELVEQEVI
jgi:crotonobetainyl-CoA:carnitine CoA-transferase CaiB-like acyl-CoA transferase